MWDRIISRVTVRVGPDGAQRDQFLAFPGPIPRQDCSRFGCKAGWEIHREDAVSACPFYTPSCPLALWVLGRASLLCAWKALQVLDVV
jgi:hypothetical protein